LLTFALLSLVAASSCGGPLEEGHEDTEHTEGSSEGALDMSTYEQRKDKDKKDKDKDKKDKDKDKKDKDKKCDPRTGQVCGCFDDGVIRCDGTCSGSFPPPADGACLACGGVLDCRLICVAATCTGNDCPPLFIHPEYGELCRDGTLGTCSAGCTNEQSGP
jgi:hypothetical protein